MAAVCVRNVRTLRSFSRFVQQQQLYLKNCISKEFYNGHRSIVVLSVRSFSLSASGKSPSNQGESESSNTDLAKTAFDLSFAEYQKLKRKIRSRQRIAGLPIAAVALMTSSAVSAYLNPNMFDAPPDQIQPIM
jgi:import inner membrane translocase subunit TIM23